MRTNGDGPQHGRQVVHILFQLRQVRAQRSTCQNVSRRGGVLFVQVAQLCGGGGARGGVARQRSTGRCVSAFHMSSRSTPMRAAVQAKKRTAGALRHARASVLYASSWASALAIMFNNMSVTCARGNDTHTHRRRLESRVQGDRVASAAHLGNSLAGRAHGADDNTLVGARHVNHELGCVANALRRANTRATEPGHAAVRTGVRRAHTRVAHAAPCRHTRLSRKAADTQPRCRSRRVTCTRHARDAASRTCGPPRMRRAGTQSTAAPPWALPRLSA